MPICKTCDTLVFREPRVYQQQIRTKLCCLWTESFANKFFLWLLGVFCCQVCLWWFQPRWRTPSGKYSSGSVPRLPGVSSGKLFALHKNVRQKTSWLFWSRWCWFVVGWHWFQSWQVMTEVWRFNFATRAWTKISKNSEQKHVTGASACCTMLPGRLLVYGGTMKPWGRSHRRQHTKKLYVE